jgi:hypothetical protein
LVANFNAAIAAEPAKTANELLDSKSNIEFLRELGKRIEGAGYSDVHLIPQMFVVLANRSDGRQTTLIVDSKTLQAVEVGNTDEAGHTFQYKAGHLFQSEAGRRSDLKPATCRLLPQVRIDDVSPSLIGQVFIDFIRTDVVFASSLRPDRSDRRCE